MSSFDQYRALRDSAAWVEREDLGRLRLSGHDRRSYLHGLLTNDVESLAPGAGVYAALLTAQGRMISDMHVYEVGDAVVVTLPRPLTPAIRDRLEQFVFSEDVQVEDVTDSTIQIGVYGPSADEAVRSLRHGQGDSVLPSRAFGIDGFEVITVSGRLQDVIASVEATGAGRAALDTLDVVRVEEGVPRFLVDMTDATIPLEAGIESRAISMTKGCYPGQEVIVRVLHRGAGRVARKLVGIAMAVDAATPIAGALLHSAAREIGFLTTVVHSWRLGRPLALGYVHRDFALPGIRVDIDLPDGTRAPAEIHALPF
jgi:folate-binding protein YgfZ